MSALIEDGLFAYLSGQSNINTVVGNRIYPSVLPQEPVLPAIVYSNIGGVPIALQNAKPVLERTRFQIDCYALSAREAKNLANEVRQSLESYVGAMGLLNVQAVFVIEHGMSDFDDVPNDFRIISEYEIWHTL